MVINALTPVGVLVSMPSGSALAGAGPQHHHPRARGLGNLLEVVAGLWQVMTSG